MQVTPLQLASATAILANRGKKITPHLILGEQIPGSDYVPYQPKEEIAVTLVDNDNWERVIKAMENVVLSPHGTAVRYGKKHDYTNRRQNRHRAGHCKRNPEKKIIRKLCRNASAITIYLLLSHRR